MRYSALLDGEHLRISARLKRVSRRRYEDSVITDLKRRGLLGDRIVLSDVQLIDSPVVLRSFGDPAFGEVLTADPSWLSLRATAPDPRHTPTKIDLVTAGLHRTQKAKWTASGFRDSSSIVRLSEDLLRNLSQWDSVKALDAIVARQPGLSAHDAELAHGLVRGLKYFATSPKALVEQSPLRRKEPTYDEILREAVQLADPNSERLLAKLLAAIEQLPSADQTRRSALKGVLQLQPESIRERIWYLAVDAWNVAVERSLDANGGLHRSLVENSPVIRTSGYSESVVGAGSPREAESIVTRFIKRATGTGDIGPFLLPEFDFGRLSWANIATTIERTQATRMEYSESPHRSADSAAIRRHHDAVASMLAASGQSKQGTGWTLLLRALAMFLANKYGMSPMETVEIGLAPIDWERAGMDGLLRQFRRGQILATLRRSGD